MENSNQLVLNEAFFLEINSQELIPKNLQILFNFQHLPHSITFIKEL